VLAWWVVAMVGLSGCAAGAALPVAGPFASAANARDCARTGPRVLSSFAPPAPGGCAVVVCSNVGACREVGR
jgi:hypothetical protein